MESIPKYDARYLAGIATFNTGNYFEAHEIWEDLWKNCPAEERLFIQSLIQAAVALYHWSRKNPTGAMKQLTRGRDKMQRYRPVHAGLNVDEFWNAVELCLSNGAAKPSIELLN